MNKNLAIPALIDFHHHLRGGPQGPPPHLRLQTAIWESMHAQSPFRGHARPDAQIAGARTVMVPWYIVHVPWFHSRHPTQVRLGLGSCLMAGCVKCYARMGALLGVLAGPTLPPPSLAACRGSSGVVDRGVYCVVVSGA